MKPPRTHPDNSCLLVDASPWLPAQRRTLHPSTFVAPINSGWILPLLFDPANLHAQKPPSATIGDGAEQTRTTFSPLTGSHTVSFHKSAVSQAASPQTPDSTPISLYGVPSAPLPENICLPAHPIQAKNRPTGHSKNQSSSHTQRHLHDRLGNRFRGFSGGSTSDAIRHAGINAAPLLCVIH